MIDGLLEGALHRSTSGHHKNDRATQTRARVWAVVGGEAEYEMMYDFLPV